MTSLSKHIVEQCLQKNEKGQYALFRHCFPMFMSIARRYKYGDQDAAALVNEAYYKVLQNLEQLKDVNAFEAWAKQIMIRTILNDFQKNKHKNQWLSPVNFEEDSGFLESEIAQDASQHMDTEHILTAIDHLKDIEKTIINLTAIEGYSQKELSDMLKMPEGTVRWHLSNARKNLKKALQSALTKFQTIAI